MQASGQKTAVRLTYVVLGFCLLAAAGSYLYLLWTGYQEEKALLPRSALDHMVKALRAYHRQAGTFPESFAQLEARVWRNSGPLNFGEDGRSLSLYNYYYIYYLVDSSTCALWAIPINKRREEGSTFFLALSPEAVRRWKGAPLALTEIGQLPSVPSTAQLALLGLTEQPPKPSQNGRKATTAGN